MGFRISGFGFRVSGSGFRVQGSGFRVQGFRCQVSGFGFRVYLGGALEGVPWRPRIHLHHRLLITEFIQENSSFCPTHAITRTMIGPCYPRSVLAPRDAPRRLTQMNPRTLSECASERRGNTLKSIVGLMSESQGQYLALSVLCVPCSLDSGISYT